jgi:hypothetical protein
VSARLRSLTEIGRARLGTFCSAMLGIGAVVSMSSGRDGATIVLTWTLGSKTGSHHVGVLELATAEVSPLAEVLAKCLRELPPPPSTSAQSSKP